MTEAASRYMNDFMNDGDEAALRRPFVLKYAVVAEKPTGRHLPFLLEAGRHGPDALAQMVYNRTTKGGLRVWNATGIESVVRHYGIPDAEYFTTGALERLTPERLVGYVAGNTWRFEGPADMNLTVGQKEAEASRRAVGVAVRLIDAVVKYEGSAANHA